MYWKNKQIIGSILLFLYGCTPFQNGFLGFAPSGDRKEYVHAREAYEQGRYAQAIEELSTYIYKTKNVRRREERAYRLLGQSYEQLGQYNKALEVYLEALTFYPKNVPLLVSAANLYQNTGLLDRAQTLYEQALEEEPEHIEALSGLAHNYYSIGFDSKAREIYDKFFSLHPSAAPIYRARYAQTFLHQRNYPQAYIHSTMAVTEQPDNADFWFLNARAAYGMGDTETAFNNLETALLLAPQEVQLLATKALWLYQAKQYASSYQTAQRILDIQPNNQLALLIQALTLSKQGKQQQAKRYLTRVVQLNETSFVGKTANGLLKTFR